MTAQKERNLPAKRLIVIDEASQSPYSKKKKQEKKKRMHNIAD